MDKNSAKLTSLNHMCPLLLNLSASNLLCVASPLLSVQRNPTRGALPVPNPLSVIMKIHTDLCLSSRLIYIKKYLHWL